MVPALLAQTVDFNREVRPILSDNCFLCHGPDEKQRMVNLRLDTKEGAFADRGGYRIIVPGDASRSKLYQKISAADKALRMPPAGAGRELSEQQIDRLRRWIEQGAKWETHWSYLPPKRPELPPVRRSIWPRNGIDRFVLARLEREGLSPSPEADRTTLIRRLSLDLTGLPPTPAEVDAFLADRSGNAYEKVVDRLLSSPRYGERMAMQWLDLARYADTHGYHIDSHRDMWPWRDWLIRAFNRNLPFDQFTIQQLAGDLLPDAGPEQKIATGFNRNHMINFEGGAIPEEYQNEYVVDRVEATATVWMGMTMGCARCHDHKYDPIRQQDFYRFYAFFNTIPEKGLDGRTGNAEPMLPLPSPEQQRLREELRTALAAAEKALPEKELAASQTDWEKERRGALPEATREGLTAHYELDGHLADTSGAYQHGVAARGGVTYTAGRVGQAVDLDGETHVELGSSGDLERSEPFTLALWIRPGGREEVAALHKVDLAGHRRGFELLLDHGVLLTERRRGSHLIFRATHRWPDDALVIETRGRLIRGTWYHVVITSDGSGKASGLRLYLDGSPAEVEVLQDSLSGSMQASARLGIGDKKVSGPYKGSLDDLRIYRRPLTAPEIEAMAVHYPIGALLGVEAGKRSREQKDRLREYYLARGAPESFRKLHLELKSLKARKEDLDKSIPTTMVMEEMKKQRETFLLERGDYRNRKEKVSPGVPSLLPPLASGSPPDRLGLARWLVDPGHPLTARVAVNRFWQLYFSSGLVKTSEDFGSQGEPPSHPELLDWLATEFVRAGWDIRAMQRLIVNSAAYRQSSRLTPELREKDPDNRLLARASRFRLPAEVVRDNALAVSGLLEERVGGPSVFPYQPPGLWEDLAYGDGFTAQEYKPSQGRDLYRRSMYTFWKRTAPPPSLAAFDAPDREKCVARRALTNTPLQALVLLNDPTYVEAARALAQRLLQEGSSPDRRLRLGFRLATARNPLPAELAVLRDLAERQLLHYRRDREAARKLLAVGDSSRDARWDAAELAAWTTVASAILNLDETITRE